MEQLLESHKLILMEAAVVEQLRRSGDVQLHATLINAPLIYDEAGKKALTNIYQAYIDIALQAGLPFLMCTPTWRANRDRVMGSGVNVAINSDAASFMQELRETERSAQGIIKIGGLIACKNDCYRPEEALPATESEQFHAWQINQLADAGVDFLIAQTLPSVEEAKGIARAMASTALPYIISFVIGRDGKLLDGTALDVAIESVDAFTEIKPLGYMVNCAYPDFVCAEKQPARVFKRLIGYLANASSLDHTALDGAGQLQREHVADWGEAMLRLNSLYRVKVMGGCCGTDEEYLGYIAREARIDPV